MQTLTVTPSLRAFMLNLIDYAGLFPPASLPLDQAFAHYTRYRQEPESWMLSRFIIPAARLEELSTTAEHTFSAYTANNELEADDRYPFSVLGRGGESVDEFMRHLRADLDAVAGFRARHEGAVSADVFEVRLPVTNDKTLLEDLIRQCVDVFEANGGFSVYYEVPDIHNQWESRVETALQVIGEIQPSARFKLRCGGTEASAFPSTDQIAFALRTCEASWISLKATAGLHHPIRHYSAEVGTKMHGFLNLFGAGVLAYFYNLNHDEIVAILEDENAEHFTFSDDHFAWKDYLHASIDSITTARLTVLTSYGSCSFDEPRADLRTLGLLA